MKNSEKPAKEQTSIEKLDVTSLLWPRLMSVATAAKYLDCSPWHMEELCRSGAVAAYKENGQAWSIDRFDLDNYVEKRKAEAQVPTVTAAKTPSALVNIYEAAAILGLTENQLRRQIAHDQIVVTKKVGKAFYFSRKYLTSWAEKVTA